MLFDRLNANRPFVISALLVLFGGCASAPSPRTSEAVQSSARDDVIRNAVSTALRQDAGLAGTRINVQVSGGVASLSGSVRTPAQARRAGNVAAGTPGVAAVRNHLAVAS